MTSSSRVMHFPPALVILALAVSVNLRAATFSFGTSRSLTSSVTVPTNTTVLSLKTRKLADWGSVIHLLFLEKLNNLGE